MLSQLDRTDYELCCECGELTGRAGKDDDSLYCPDCNDGPFCEECIVEHIHFAEGKEYLWP